MNTTAFDRLVEALGGHGVTVQGNTARARCPGHEGENKSSLAVRHIDGSVLLYCHVGCTTEQIVAGLGWTMRDLYDDPAGMQYRYTDNTGTVLRTVHRSPEKKFRQTIADKSVVPLYRLPQVTEAVRAGTGIWLVEGEKDVHALESLGAVATTAPQGGGNFAKVDVEPLRGARVRAVVDRDDVGDRWAHQVREKLDGVVASLEFAIAKTGKDAADHIAAGGGRDDFMPYELDEDEADDPDAGRRLQLTSAADIKPRPIRWLWEQRLALGTIGLLAGREGLGKSTLAYWLAARITKGELPGDYEGTTKSVLVCATEDSWEHTIVPRLMAAGADLHRVYRVEVINAEEVHVGLMLPRDLSAVERAAREVDAGLMLLDPLMSRLGDLDTHRDSEVRQALEPLAALADRSRMAVLGLIHHNKSGSTDPLQLVMGSKAFTAVARSVHTVVPDPDDETEQRRLFGSPKSNLGRGEMPTLGFTITSHAIDTEEGTAWTGKLEWVEGEMPSISEAMRAAGDDDHSATGEAGAWLTDYLTMNGGTAPSADIKAAGAKEGHSYDALKRARRRHKFPVEYDGFPRKSYWSLPGTQSEQPSECKTAGQAQSEQQSEQIPRGDALTALTALTGGRKTQSEQSEQSEQDTGSGAPTVLHDLITQADGTSCSACDRKLSRVETEAGTGCCFYCLPPGAAERTDQQESAS